MSQAKYDANINLVFISHDGTSLKNKVVTDLKSLSFYVGLLMINGV